MLPPSLFRAVLTALLLSALPHTAAGAYPDNEDGPYEDMLTPVYYTRTDSGALRAAINEYIHYARLIPCVHPLAGTTGVTPDVTIGKDFGDGTGPGGTAAHHPAVDLYQGGATQVHLYAAHSGTVHTGRDISRYRQYISITTDVYDSTGTAIGRLMTLYAHVDLDLDTAAGLSMDGRYVRRGELVSGHLYAGTVGGPHLHCEIRYYRPSDTGIEDFYGGRTADKTVLSAGSWDYGYWNPDAGYGFADPRNHFPVAPAGLPEQSSAQKLRMDVRRTAGGLHVWFPAGLQNSLLQVTDIAGNGIYRRTVCAGTADATIPLPSGRDVYVLSLSVDGQRVLRKIILY